MTNSPRSDFTAADYVAAIPMCCSLRTLEEHESIMLCWGLCAAIRAGQEMDCSGCCLQRSLAP